MYGNIWKGKYACVGTQQIRVRGLAALGKRRRWLTEVLFENAARMTIVTVQTIVDIIQPPEAESAVFGGVVIRAPAWPGAQAVPRRPSFEDLDSSFLLLNIFRVMQ